MFEFYFLKDDGTVIRDYASAKQYADTERYGQFFHEMLNRDIYFAPSQYEAGFMSYVHADEDIEHTLFSAKEVLESLN